MLHLDVLLQALLLAKKSLREGTEATDYSQGRAALSNCRFLLDAAISNINEEIGNQEAAGVMKVRELAPSEKEYLRIEGKRKGSKRPRCLSK